MSNESIFAAALAIASPAERAAYLDRACAGQPSLRREVEGLLAAHAASNPLDRPAVHLGRTGAYEPAAEESPAASVGDRIGPYRLMEQIGEGGFGLVFVAEQAEPVRRKVALKVLKPGMDTRDVVARFEAERQALALMEHPNIAKVLDAGSTAAGRPYFAMELVRGVHITDYCDQQKLSPRDRLALFMQVCQAVQHAHQKGIIHRDIKPSNVLVAPHDGVPVVKVIDFGVAKALGQSLTEKTIYTRFAQMIGTPLYMSPEQAEINQLDVDTRADVYALGVLLYELLTGTTPFDKDRFRKAAFDEIRRILREEEPPRPSTRLSSLGATLTAVSARRGTDPGKLAGLVRGELDWIVMRCLEKDRNRRYETANGLAKDVQRYLAGDAVEACPPTVGYRLRKFVRRHRRGVIFTGVLLVFALASLVAQTVQVLRANRAEAEAARQRDEAVAAQQTAAIERDNVSQANQALRRLAIEQRQTLYATSLNLAQAAWEAGDPARTFELLRQQLPKQGEEDFRGFEWHYWERFAHQDLKTVRIAGFGDDSGRKRRGRLSPDGTRVAAFVTDAIGSTTLKLWDVDTGKVVWTAPVPADTGSYPFLAFSHDGRRLISVRNLNPRDERGASDQYELRVWETTTGRAVQAEFFPEGSYVLSPALSPDGSHFCARVRPRGVGSFQLSVRRVADGKEVFCYPRDKSGGTPLFADFSPDGKRFAAVINDRRSLTLRIWELDTGRELQRMSLQGDFSLALCFSPDGARIATAMIDRPNDQIILWDTASGKKLDVLNVPATSGPYTVFYPLAFDPSGKRLAVRHDAVAYLFDTDPKRATTVNPLLRRFCGHADWVRDLAFSGQGSRVVTLDEKGIVKQWDPAPRERPLRTAFSSAPLGRRFALANLDGSRIAIVPGRDAIDHGIRFTDGSGRRLGGSALPPGHSHNQVFSRDGRTFALLWHEDPLPGTYVLFVWDVVTGKQINRISPPRGQDFAGLALSPDGSRIVTYRLRSAGSEGSGNLILSVRETATGREVLAKQVSVYGSLTFSPDGQWMVCSDAWSRADDRVVWLNAQTAEEGATLKVRDGHLGRRDRLTFSRDGRRLATYTIDGPSTLLVWDVEPILRGETPKPVVTLTGHGGEISHVDFSPDGARVLTAGGGAVKLWDIASGREVLTLKANGSVLMDALFSPDGQTVWAGLDEHDALWGWDGSPMTGEKRP